MLHLHLRHRRWPIISSHCIIKLRVPFIVTTQAAFLSIRLEPLVHQQPSCLVLEGAVFSAVQVELHPLSLSFLLIEGFSRVGRGDVCDLEGESAIVRKRKRLVWVADRLLFLRYFYWFLKISIVSL